MKVPDPTPPRPRLYTIPPSAPFLSILAKALLNGDLPTPGGAKPDPLTLPHATIYLPTRRAVRALREAFLDASGGKAALLPRIRALGDPDEDAAVIFGAEAEAEGGFIDGAPGGRAIGPLERRLALMSLVLAWNNTERRALLSERRPLDPIPPEMTPAQASYLASDLADLMDFAETEEADLASLEDLVPDAYAVHWQRTVTFLKIVVEHWPHYLAEHGLVTPAARRNALMALEAQRLVDRPPPGPVIAAGSTGTVPVTAQLLKVIASLPNGAVVLPGLDLDLDEESWESLPRHPEHPQAGMAQLLGELGAARSGVSLVPGSEPDSSQAARLRIVSEVLRPSGHTELWQDFLTRTGERGVEAAKAALSGLHLVATPTAHDEAEAIALIMRSVVEAPGKSAALVTPDRVLARRVAARLRSYGLAIDDSAGVPVARTVPGGFLELVASAVESDFEPSSLMALLKHPLTLLGRNAGNMRFEARTLERAAFRDVYIGRGLLGVAEAVASARDKTKRSRVLVSEEGQRTALKLVHDLTVAFEPLASLYRAGTPCSAARLAEAHAATAAALAADHAGSSSRLWQGDAGEAMSVLIAELIGERRTLMLAPADYAPFYRSLVAGRAARPRLPAHPRLFIWGPLEARLQQPDVVILGSLNEGVWPRPQEASPWFSRSMSADLGLAPPERRVGLSAHDFAQALGARTVYLSRAVKVEGVPTVPSRWIQRLSALVRAAKLQSAIAPDHPFAAWARERDSFGPLAPAAPPKPKPPVDARPRALSVTRIEKWIANPYDIFARDILNLRPLNPLVQELDARSRGTLVHKVMQDFTALYPDCLPADIEGELRRMAEEQFQVLGASPRVQAFWRPAFHHFARWFAATEPARRAGGARPHTELTGILDVAEAGGFRLTARADRIDLGADGSGAIYDYKTTKPPLLKHVEKLFAPQLPLEAAIAEGGGFTGLDKISIAKLAYIYASGRREGGEEMRAGKSEPGDLSGRALERLKALIAKYADPDMPYEAKRRGARAFERLYRYDDYEHLARIREWLTQEAPEEPQ